LFTLFASNFLRIKVKKIYNSFNWLYQIPLPIVLLDESYNVIGASTTWYKKLELKETIVEEKNFFELFPQYNKVWKKKINAMKKGLCNIKIKEKFKNLKGEEINYIWHLTLLKDEAGKNVGVILQVDEALETESISEKTNFDKSSLKHKNNSKIASWEYDTENNKIFWSPAIKQILDIPKNAKLTLEEYISSHKEGTSRKTIRKVIKNAIKNGNPWNENLHIITSEKKEILIKSIGRPKFTEQNCTRIIGTIQDITEKIYAKKNIEEASKKSNYEQLFKSSPVAMIVIDYENGIITNTNTTTLKLTGFKKQEIIGSDCFKYCKVSKQIKFEILKRLKRNTDFKLLDLKILNKKNLGLVIDIDGQLIIDGENKKKIILSVFDVTLRKKQQKILLAQNDEANDEIEKLVNFAHMSSHNLKGHATNLSLLLDFLENEQNPNKQKELMLLLVKSSNNLSESIKGLREIVSIRQNLQLKKKDLNINEFINNAIHNLSGIIKKEDAKIINNIKNSEKVRALSAYLDSILFHIIGNSLKFKQRNKRPLITINIKKINDYTILSIEDNGVGIDLDKYKDRLYGLYKSLGYSGETRGMGLYLVRYQMELMNGKIECDSTVNHGTTFRLFFPNI